MSVLPPRLDVALRAGGAVPPAGSSAGASRLSVAPFAGDGMRPSGWLARPSAGQRAMRWTLCLAPRPIRLPCCLIVPQKTEGPLFLLVPLSTCSQGPCSHHGVGERLFL